MTEFAFLQELRFLCDAAYARGETILDLAEAWSETDRRVRETIQGPPRKKTSDQRAEEQRFRAKTYGEQVERQTLLFSELEAFLALFGRTSLIFFPVGRQEHPERRHRGQTLREVVGITEDHPIYDRTLRNKWMHFDEQLDDLSSAGTHRPTPQRFITSDRLEPSVKNQAIRLFVADTLEFHYRGIGDFDLGEMIRAFRDLDGKVHEALRTWEDRRLPDLLENEGGEDA